MKLTHRKMKNRGVLKYLNTGLLVVLSSLASAAYSQEGEPAQIEEDEPAQIGVSEPVQIEVGSSLDTLDKNQANWHSYYLEGEKKLGDRHVLYGSIRETERFNIKDTEALAGIYYPLAKRWTLLAEGNASNTHNVLPRWSALGQIQYAFDDGWGMHLGLRHTAYNSALVNILLVTGERYWSNYRAAYTHYFSNLAGVGSRSSGRVQLSRYYDERSWIGISFSEGDEIEDIGPPLGVVNSRVQYLGLNGRHWFNSNWAVSYEVGTTKQGSFYTRNTLRLGVRHQF